MLITYDLIEKPNPMSYKLLASKFSVFMLIFFIACSNEKENPAPTEPVFTGYNKDALPNTVRVLYIVPSDRELQENYTQALANCITQLKTWYATNLDAGKTFQLNPDFLVETLHSDHETAWFNAQNEQTGAAEFYFYGNARNAVMELLGQDFKPEQYTYLVYVDAPGTTGAGALGFTAMPENDLLGLTDQMEEPVARWIGGAGHELGHAFGLPHPENENPEALMFTGYVLYPNCILQDTDKTILSQSAYFVSN